MAARCCARGIPCASTSTRAASLQRLAAAGPGSVVRKGDGDDSMARVDGWLAGQRPEACLRRANAMGAICVTGHRDYEGLPERASLEGFRAGARELGR